MPDGDRRHADHCRREALAGEPSGTEVLRYGLNEGPALEGSRFIPEDIGDEAEVDRGQDRPNLAFAVVFLPTAVAPVTVGGREMAAVAASVQDFLRGPAA